jgi:hypothetical protein
MLAEHGSEGFNPAWLAHKELSWCIDCLKVVSSKEGQL